MYSENEIFLVELILILLVFIVLVIYSHFKSQENLTSKSVCEGKRDGVSGCRDCCQKLLPSDYQDCVSHCMLF